MKKLLALVAVTAVGATAAPATAATKRVRVDDNVFAPKSLTVSKGTKLSFRWVGDAPHNVVRTGGPRFKAISTRRSGTVSRRLRRKGTYRLTCTIHPGMNLRVTAR